jgi:molybdopterin converting factor small subunit
MSTSSTGDFNLSLTTGGSIEDTVTALVEVVETQQETINELQQTVDDLRDELAETRDAVNNEREERTLDVAKDRQRLTDVEERLDAVESGGSPDESPTPETDDNDSSTPSTPLERVCAFSEDVAERELTANQSRARFVARDVTDYADSVPAGYAIRSGDIATVLRAGTDCNGRTQTVARVMDFLDDLGGDGVDVVERRGTKRVVFSEETAHRLERLASSPSSPSDNTVVMSGTV